MEIDKLYELFSLSYQHKDIQLFQSIYLEEAQYLIFDGKISNGHNGFIPGTQGFFDEVQLAGDSLDIQFQIEQRFYSKDSTMVTDVGYFHFERKGSVEESSVGKMVNVFVKRNQDWKWLVDMSSNAPKEAFKLNN